MRGKNGGGVGLAQETPPPPLYTPLHPAAHTSFSFICGNHGFHYKHNSDEKLMISMWNSGSNWPTLHLWHLFHNFASWHPSPRRLWTAARHRAHQPGARLQVDVQVHNLYMVSSIGKLPLLRPVEWDLAVFIH